MVRVNDRVYFTKEDKLNMVYKEYSKLEIKEQQKQFKQKRRKKRIMRMIILCIFIVMLRFEQLECVAGVAICGMIFLIIEGEWGDWVNKKLYSRPYYIEIQVEKKLPTEHEADYTVNYGPLVKDFFPVEGHDTTSGYQSVFYVDSEQYLNANVGSIFRKSLAVIGDDLPSAPDNVKN